MEPCSVGLLRDSYVTTCLNEARRHSTFSGRRHHAWLTIFIAFLTLLMRTTFFLYFFLAICFSLQIYARMLNLRLNYLFRVGTIIYFNSWFTTTIMYSVWAKFRLRPPPVGIWFCTDPYSTWLWCPINHHHNLLEWVFLQTTTAISTLDTRIADIFFSKCFVSVFHHHCIYFLSMGLRECSFSIMSQF